MKAIAGYYRKFKAGATLKDLSESINGSLPASKTLTDEWLWTARSSEKIKQCENVACLLKK